MKLHDINVEEGRLKNLAMAGALLGAGLGAGAGCHKAPPPPGPGDTFQQRFRSKAQEADKKRLRDKAEQLRSKGLTSGTFIHGELQEPGDDDAGDYEPPNSKRIKSSSVTSDDAADY